MDQESAIGSTTDRTDEVAARMLAVRDALRSTRSAAGRSTEPLRPPSEAGGTSGEAFPGADRELGAALRSAVLAAIVPAAVDDFSEPLNETFRAFEITTPLRVAHFMAQTAHESARYTVLVENLNYGAAGLLATWPTRFDADRAAAYARQPERIASYVYGGRMGNGPEASGDGWRFRGRGILQITGRDTYREVGRFLGVDLEAEPDLLVTPRLAALAAGWYWRARAINELCDADDVVAVTEAVNGGRHGLEDRMKLLGAAKAALASPDALA